MKRVALGFATLVAVAAVGSSFPIAEARAHGTAHPAGPRANVHDARGVIKGFSPEKASVSIAHEAIPGFMAAMTMSFDAARPDQLRDLSVGDRVRFAFEVTGEGRRILVSIEKEATPR